MVQGFLGLCVPGNQEFSAGVLEVYGFSPIIIFITNPSVSS